jgi:hypothetical protein
MFKTLLELLVLCRANVTTELLCGVSTADFLFEFFGLVCDW